MKSMSVQIQPGLLAGIDISAVIQQLKQAITVAPAIADTSVSVESGPDYVNLNFVTPDAPELWRRISSTLGLKNEQATDISRGITVVCEGEHGWDDYLLLHHFGDNEPVDTFDAAKRN